MSDTVVRTAGEHERAADTLTQGASPEIAKLIHNSMKGLDDALARIDALERRVAALEKGHADGLL